MNRDSLEKLPDFSAELDKTSPDWRSKYQAWRQGGTKGAKGEHPDEKKEPLLGALVRGFTDPQLIDMYRGPARLAKFIPGGTNGQTNAEAVINLLNNCLGCGMLGVSFALTKTGLLVGLVVMLGSAVMNAYTLLLHQKACKIVQCSSGGTELAETIFGGQGKLFMTVLLTCFGYFCMVSMVVGSADAFYGLITLSVPVDNMPSEHMCMILCWICFLLPPTLIRSMKSIAVLSLVAMIACFVLVVMILTAVGQHLVSNGLPAFADIKWFPDDAIGLMQGVPTLLMVFSIQACGGVVLATMQDTRIQNMTKVTVQSYIMVFSLDALVGASVYLAFLTNTQSDIIKNLPASSALSVIAMVAQLVLLALSYMLMIIPCKIALLELIFGKNEEKMEATLSQFYSVTGVVNVLALLNGLAMSDLSLIFSINGAVFTNLLAFILPSILYMKARAKPNANEGIVKVTLIQNVGFMVIFAFGICSLIVCSYQVVQDVMNRKPPVAAQ